MTRGEESQFALRVFDAFGCPFDTPPIYRVTFDDGTGRPQARRLWPCLRIKKRTRWMMSAQIGMAIAVNSKVSIIGASHLSV